MIPLRPLVSDRRRNESIVAGRRRRVTRSGPTYRAGTGSKSPDHPLCCDSTLLQSAAAGSNTHTSEERFPAYFEVISPP